MTLPGQTITRTDGGLGLSNDAANRILYVTPSSAGTANAITGYTSSSKLRTALGVGDGIEAACWKLDNEGGAVDVLKVNANVAAVISAVTQSGTGPLITLSGTPTITTTATVQITLGGARGTAKFAYTLDGETWVENITVPAGGTYLLSSTGVTVTFPAGTYVLAETYAFTTTPATYNLSDLSTTAWGVAVDHENEWPIIVLCGFSASAAAAATIAAGVITLAAQMEAAYKYPRILISCGNDTEANVLSAFASVQSNYLMLEHGTVQMYVGTKIPGWSWPRLPYVYEKARRCAAVAAATNPAWVGLPDDVAVSLIKNPSFDEFKSGETLHDAKINTMRTYPRRRGILPTNALLKSAAGSDYRYFQWGRVIDIASSTIQFQQQKFINRSVRTVVTGTAEQIGCLEPKDAVILAKDVIEDLDAKLVKQKTSEGIDGFCSAYSYRISTTNQILTSRRLESSARLVPLANIEEVVTEIGMAMSVEG